MYNEIAPILDMVKKMIKNEDLRNKVNSIAGKPYKVTLKVKDRKSVV